MQFESRKFSSRRFCAGYLARPTSITLTTTWQRFKITGTLAGGQTGLRIVLPQFAGNGDNWMFTNPVPWLHMIGVGVFGKPPDQRTDADGVGPVLYLERDLAAVGMYSDVAGEDCVHVFIEAVPADCKRRRGFRDEPFVIFPKS